MIFVEYIDKESILKLKSPQSKNLTYNVRMIVDVGLKNRGQHLNLLAYYVK